MTTSPIRTRLIAGLCLLMTLTIGGCGGGSDDTPAAQQAASNEVQGLMADASGSAPAEVHVRGATGLPRTTAASADGSYHLTLRGLTSPYLVNTTSAVLFSSSTGEPWQLYALATSPGRVNVTPLTTLLLAQLTGQEPRAVYNTLGRQSALSFSAAQVSSAEDAVADYLSAVFDVPVPASVRNFVAADFAARAGDPMFDVLSALTARLAQLDMDIGTLARRVALQVVRCSSTRLRIDVGGRTRDFCPSGGTTDVDALDPTLTLHHFDSDDNGSLDIRDNGSTISDATWTSPAGTAYTCQASACAGLSLGVPTGDGSRTITAGNLVLSDGSGGIAGATGSVLAAAPDVPLAATLTCTINRYTLRFADGRTLSNCLVTDDIGQGGTFGTRRGHSERRFFSFFGIDFAQQIDLTVDGDAFAHLVLFAVDPATNERVAYACRASDCTGLGFAANQPDPLAMGYRVRPVTLTGTRLTRLGSDGVFDPSDTVTVTTTLLAMTDPFAPIDIPSDCNGATQSMTAALTGTTRSYGICPPADDPTAAFSQFDVDGVSLLLFARSPNFQSISVTVVGDVVTRAVFDAGSLSERFACGRTSAGEPPCDAITYGPPDADGNRLLRVQGQRLVEIESGDLVGSRGATLDGSITITAPPPADPPTGVPPADQPADPPPT